MTVIACSFSGAAADLPPRKRTDADILACLRKHPRVSVWDMTELSWLRTGIESLQRRGLIRDDRKEPFPWIRYTVIEAAQDTRDGGGA
jgi:hypothetical protein